MSAQSTRTTSNRPYFDLLPRLAALAAMSAFALMVVLHFLKPDFSPISRFISEYEIGDYGALMRVAFVFMGLSSLFVALSLWRFATSFVAKVGLIFHALVAISLFGAALFVSDPASLPPSELSAAGKMHVVFSMIGIPCGPIAALMVAYAMTQKRSVDRRQLIWPAWALTISAAVMFVYVNSIMASGRPVGPNDYVGLANRIVVLVSVWWWMAAALFASRLGTLGIHSNSSPR